MVDLTDDSTRMGPAFKPLWIGLHWPSLPWGDESSGSFDPTEGKTLEVLLEETVAHFGGTDAVRSAVKPIFDAYGKDPGASDIPPEATQGYRDLAAAIEFSAGTADAAAGAPDQDGEPLDPQAALDADNMAAQSFGVAGAIGGGILSALRQLSFWTMKKRAVTVGEGGMHQFIAAVQKVSETKIHLIGHSFGCIVASSILNGPKGVGVLPRPINSVAMLQGALSLWAYADAVPGSQHPGYFRSVLTRKVVSGPIITTQSRNDSAVGVLYPAAVGLVREADFGTELPQLRRCGHLRHSGQRHRRRPGDARQDRRLSLRRRQDLQPREQPIHRQEGGGVGSAFGHRRTPGRARPLAGGARFIGVGHGRR